MVAPDVLGVAGVHVCALELPDEGPNKVDPTFDQSLGKVLQPCPGRVGQMQRQVADDEC